MIDIYVILLYKFRSRGWVKVYTGKGGLGKWKEERDGSCDPSRQGGPCPGAPKARRRDAVPHP